METISTRLTIGDVLRYLLAYTLWALLSAASGLFLLLWREPIKQLTALILAGNPYYKTHMVEAGGIINSVDRFGLLIMGIVWVVYIIFAEEYLRGSIASARERRIRISLAPETAPALISDSRLRRWELDILAQRLPKLLLFPAILLGIGLLLVVIAQVWVRTL